MKNKILANFHLIFFVMAAMNLFELYEEKSQKIENSNNSIQSLEAKKIKQTRKLKQIETFKKNLSQSKTRVVEVVKQIEKVQKQLPSDVNDAQVATKLTEVANNLKFQNIRITPLNEENNGFYFTKKYSLKSEGTFLQSMILFESVQKEERILNIHKLELKEMQSDARGRFKVLYLDTEIESYRYNSGYKEKSGVKEIEQKFKVR